MRTFFKKPVNVNFISVLSIIILLAGLAVIFGIFAAGAGNESAAVGSAIDEMRAGEVGDVEGWGMLLMGAVGLTGVMVSAFCWFFAIIFFLMALFLFIPLLTARLLYSNAGGRLLAYRIIMGITYLLMLPLLMLLFSFIGMSVSITVFAILGVLLLLVVLGLNVINTYSNRIKN